MVHYVKQPDKIEIRLATPENVQECVVGMELDFCKYNKFRVQQQIQQQLNT